MAGNNRFYTHASKSQRNYVTVCKNMMRPKIQWHIWSSINLTSVFQKQSSGTKQTVYVIALSQDPTHLYQVLFFIDCLVQVLGDGKEEEERGF